MKIIVDSGSTKCTWLLCYDTHTDSLRTAGINAMQQSRQEIDATLATLPQVRADEVIFYGAGCGAQFPEATKKITDALSACFQTPHIEAHSDLLAAARALCGDGEGIACILGTGSNSCLCRGGEIVDSVPPLGYILGDEGSGAALGRGLLNGVFKRHISLREELLAACGMTYEQIIRRVYAEPGANRFLASLAPFVHTHINHPEVRAMVAGCFREFAARNLSRYPAGVPVSLIGGIAAHFEPLLRETLTQAGYPVQTIVESPAEGLLKYHYGV